MTTNNPSEELINSLDFCVFDLETTGGNHKNDKIIEIGLVKVVNLKITEKKSFLINPEIKIPEFIQKLTSITPKDVVNSHKIHEVIDEVLDFMKDTILVAHNTSFDVPFFNSVLQRLDLPLLENKSICTNLMTKYLIPNLLNSNLNYMSKVFNISHNKAHRALDDAYATAELLIKYLNIFIDKKITKINHLYYPRNKYELDRFHCKSKVEIDDLKEKFNSLQTPCLLTIKGTNGVILHAIPVNNTPEEKKYCCEQLDKIDWESATIRLFGSFVEAFSQFNNLFNKIDTLVRAEIITKLNEYNLPSDMKEIKKSILKDDEKSELLKKNTFIICPHLVPEQLIIYPLSSLHPKSSLIFRYPGHKKKLLQFITSRAQKVTNNKLKKSFFLPPIKEFLDNYFLYNIYEKKELIIFDKDFALKNQEGFMRTTENFLSKNNKSYNYPQKYI